jgi:hypothetical protein
MHVILYKQHEGFATIVVLPVAMAVRISLSGERKEHVCTYYMSLPNVRIHTFAYCNMDGALAKLYASHKNPSCFLDDCLEKKVVL